MNPYGKTDYKFGEVTYMQTQLNQILQEAKEQLEKAQTMAETEEVRVRVLGKKG